ncbi:hypothetical protein BC937DRAFT_87462 [Endogone sp. FLAS-F59071]|nr:hypothetical protein BC937DRAFT_87462 [Endogone sp. FLAS-F59071]|eukprot:RUS12590.1 hypothetical protein BC937DRAFT_87462 [Endogone sp. FLAS-F59071]
MLPHQVSENSKSLYVGNLDPRVTDFMLKEIFSSVGLVDNVKIIPDKNKLLDERSAQISRNGLTAAPSNNHEPTMRERGSRGTALTSHDGRGASYF